jgi:hypothetical protein
MRKCGTQKWLKIKLTVANKMLIKGDVKAGNNVRSNRNEGLYVCGGMEPGKWVCESLRKEA